MQKLFRFGEGFHAPVEGRVLGPDAPPLLSELLLMKTLRAGRTVRENNWNFKLTDALDLTTRYRTASKADFPQRARRRLAVLRQTPGDVKTHRPIVPPERLQVAG